MSSPTRAGSVLAIILASTLLQGCNPDPEAGCTLTQSNYAVDPTIDTSIDTNIGGYTPANNETPTHREPIRGRPHRFSL